MTIHNLKSYVDNLWNWGILDECFEESKIKPTDIDAMVERRGQFLLIEAKSINKDIPLGQKIIFDSLRKLGNFTIIVVWGKPDIPSFCQLFTKNFVSGIFECDLNDFKNIVHIWYTEANNKKSVDFKKYFKD